MLGVGVWIGDDGVGWGKEGVEERRRGDGIIGRDCEERERKGRGARCLWDVDGCEEGMKDADIWFLIIGE